MLRPLSFSKLIIVTFLISFIASCGRNEKQLVEQESSDPKINKLKMPAGFKAERLYSPGENEHGPYTFERL